MAGVIRKKNTGDAWETVLDTGSGGSLPEGWTQSGDPAIVETHNGDLDVGQFGAVKGGVDTSGSRAFLGEGQINLDTYDGGGLNTAQATLAADTGINLSPASGQTAILVRTDFGAIVALDCGTLPIVNLPTVDPGIAGALWNNGGSPAISTG